MAIDWDAPIEAIHEDGRVVPVEKVAAYGSWCDVSPRLDGGETYSFKNDGMHPRKGWSIRNVQTAAADEATTRALALVERLATATGPVVGLRDEARAIQALRSAPVDPRLEPVVRSLVANGVSRPVAPLFARDVLKALDGVS